MTRDQQNYRAAVDLLDPHNGIGELCILDLDETPMSVMQQGKRAADEILRTRRLLKLIENAAKYGDAEKVQDYLREHRRWEMTQAHARTEAMVAYHAVEAEASA